jgi:hypothetical protein
MAADLERGAAMPPQDDDEHGRTLFAYEAVQDGRLVTRIVGIRSGHADVRVVAEVYPVHLPEASEPQWRFYDFATHDEAYRFADEALLALEYLGCSATDTVSHGTGAPDRALAGAVAA